MLRLIEEQWPGFDPVARMIEQAELGRLELLGREDLRQRALTDEPLTDAEQATVDAGGIPAAIQLGERNSLSQMYERAAKFLAPQLKALDLSAPGGLDGEITVRFQRSADEDTGDVTD